MKKQIIYSIIVLFMGLNLQAQVVLSDKNYIYTMVPQTAMTIVDIENVNCSNINDMSNTIENVIYFDGLGRPIQQRAIKASPNGKDIVTHINYDKYGRQNKQYLPFEADNTIGGYKAVNINTDINQYYKDTYANDFIGIDANHNDFNAYSQSIFEKSPLNRVLEQGAPGKTWKIDTLSDNDHTIKFDWNTNTVNEVAHFKVNFANPGNTEVPSLIKNGYYAASRLYVTVIKDENWTPASGNNHTTREYKDKQGKVVLKRTYADTDTNNDGVVEIAVAHDAYYVYDSFGNLTYILSPKVNMVDGVDQIELDELCYQYKYDNRNRLIEKKIPGKDWEYIVYNKLNQPILTQDASLRKENSGKPWNQWIFTKYDVYGRVIYTGSVINGSTRAVLQNRANNFTGPQYETKVTNAVSIGGTTVYYSKATYPTSIYKVYTINYHDDYNFDLVGFSNPGMIYGETISNQTKTLPTGSKIRVFDTNDWITTVTYYDIKARPIYVANKNEYLNTTDIVETQLDFVGKVEEIKSTHTKDSNTPIVTLDTFTYDHMGRMRTQTQKINNQTPEVIASNTYDALGQLKNKKVGGGLQEAKYDYNVRGWLKGINDVNNIGNNLFAFKINYNTPQHGATALFNGNISETTWKTANDNVERYYKYSYDALHRILSATSNDTRYNVSNISYDKMGNIMTLNRSGWQNTSNYTNLDVLGYTYDSGNKLLSVTDTGNKAYGFRDGSFTGNDYAYDTNGNLIQDKNKGITNVTYDHFNAPTSVIVVSSEHTGNIQYVYDATGVKLKKTATDNGNVTTVEYNGNFVYENGSLKSITHPEGYIEKEDDGSFTYVYEHRDIWQNTRITYADNDKDGKIDLVQNGVDVDGDGDYHEEIRREQNYYPFGMTWEGVNSTIRNATNNLKTFQGQELTEDLGLNTHEWRYRMSDRSIGRFWQIDPLSEDYMYNSTYAFQENKMGMGIELEGKELKKWFFDIGTRVGLISANHPKNNPNSRRAKDPLYAIHNSGSSTSTGPTKNITGNYFGDTVYKLIGGGTFSRALDGDHKAQFRVLSGAMLSLAPGSRINPSDDISKAITKISTKKIRFSQTSVNGLEEIANSMKKNGWKGDAIDIVKMIDGKFTSLDNTRVLAAHEAGIDVEAIVHNMDDLLPDNLIERFTTKKGVPKTWGDAIKLRIGKQNSGYRNTYPEGSQVINGKN